MSYSFTPMPQTATDIHMESMMMFAMLTPPLPCRSWLYCTTMFDCLCPPVPRKGHNQWQRHLHCTNISLQSRLEMVAYIALVQTDTHKQTQAHDGEGESAYWECLLKPKMKSEVWQSGYLTWKTMFSSVGCSTGRGIFTGRVDIPPLALKHHNRQPGDTSNTQIQTSPSAPPYTHLSETKPFPKWGDKSALWRQLRKPLFPPPTAEAGEPVEDF